MVQAYAEALGTDSNHAHIVDLLPNYDCSNSKNVRTTRSNLQGYP